MNLIKTIVEAREFAQRAHGNQRYGGHPYVVHLDEVADIALLAALDLAAMGSGLDLVLTTVCVAYGHDILEDTDVNISSIIARFGPEVGAGCAALKDPPGKNRRERKARLHENLGRVSSLEPLGRVILIVKASDRLANLRRSAGVCGDGDPGLLRMYREEAAAFRAAVHRPGLCDRVWEEIDRISLL